MNGSGSSSSTAVATASITAITFVIVLPFLPLHWAVLIDKVASWCYKPDHHYIIYHLTENMEVHVRYEKCGRDLGMQDVIKAFINAP